MKYQKIQTMFKRDSKTKRIIEGEYSLPEFEYLKDNIWVATEKVDGTNIGVHYIGDKILFGGKEGEDSQIPASLINVLNELFPLEKFKKLYPDIDMSLFGEGYGKNIQDVGGHYNPNGVGFVLFDVKIGKWWLERKNIIDVAEKLKIDIVPVVHTGTLSKVAELVKKGFNSAWGEFLAEGMVLKPQLDLNTRSGDRIITKIKHKDFK